MPILNEQQYLASRPNPGVSLVIAGAGTGKTKILVEKVKNIINEGIAKPQEVLILTFSSKAAQEIKDRVKSEVGRDADAVTSGTFHSFCLSFLRNYSNAFLSSYGFKRFPGILDQEEKDKILDDLLRDSIDMFMGLPAGVVAGLLESAGRLDKRTFKKLVRLGIIRELHDFNQQFRTYKVSHNLMDFGDMMDYAIGLMERNTAIREETVGRFKYVLVDEFQDTSEDNFRLLKLILPARNRNLFLVGDDWQSIYAFRGSRIDYIVKMKKYFPGAVIHRLRLNYRSRKEIVTLSNDFIRKNKYRTKKELKSVRGRGGMVKDYCVNSLEEETGVIADILENERMDNKKKNPNDIAVLYRNNWQGSYIKAGLDPGFNTEDSVRFMTIHSSKGLEFDTVVIAGVSDDIIPDQSSDIEEERRLFYVALTRAKDSLHILHYKSADGGPSVFAEELGFSVSSSGS